MFLSAEEIETTTGWLLQNGSAPVRYRTHRDIVGADPASEAMDALWREVAAGPEADMLFSRQNEDGSWFSGGPWGPRGYKRTTGRGFTATRPKFVTTAWLLPYLGEMGFTVQDPRIRRAVEQVVAEADYAAVDPGSCPEKPDTCGLYAIPLRALASVGMADDARLRGGWDWLALCQRDDGGWLNPNHLADSPTPSKTQGRWPWDRSCAWGSYWATQALFYAGAPYRDALEAALGFLVWHLGQATDPAAIRSWAWHGHNTVKELLMAAEAGLDVGTGPLAAQLDWLRGYYRSGEGCFRVQEKPIASFTRQVAAIVKARGEGYWSEVAKVGVGVLRYHLWHLVEDDWLTYWATRIGVAMSRVA